MEVALIIILALVIAAFLGYLYFRDKEERLERSKMLNAILAKNHQEMINLEVLDKSQPEKQAEETQRFEDTENLTNEEYIDMETRDVNENT